MRPLTLAAVVALASVSMQAQVITTVAGNGIESFCGDNGPATTACVTAWAVATDAAGNIYVADIVNNRVRRIDSAGTITTVAGSGTPGECGDVGPATSICLNSPSGVAVDAAGNLFIADQRNHRVRRVDAGGAITTVAGNGTFESCGDGGPATSACVGNPFGVAVDNSGNLFIGEWANNRVRKVDSAGTITTVAGNGTEGFCGDNGPATSACLNHPGSVAVDAAGNLFIGDAWNHRVRKVGATGTITTVAGTGAMRFCGDGHAAATACLAFPFGVAVDAIGNLFIADTHNHRVRKVDTAGTITTVAGIGTGDFCGDGGNGTQACLDHPYGVIVSGAGATDTLLIADTLNSRVRQLDIVPGPLTLSSTQLSGCLKTTGRVTLTAPAPVGGAVVTLASDSLHATVPAVVKIKAGALAKGFPVTTTAVASEETATITANGPDWTRSIVVRLMPMAPKTVTLAPNPVVGGSPVNATVTLECAAGPGNVVVALTSTKPAAAMPATPTVTVPFGMTTAAFTVTTAMVAKNTKSSIEATTDGGAAKMTLTVTP